MRHAYYFLEILFVSSLVPGFLRPAGAGGQLTSKAELALRLRYRRRQHERESWHGWSAPAE